MPVQSVDVRDGDPTIQASGQYRGTVDVTMTDGRVFTLNIRAASQDEWNDRVTAAAATIQAQVERRDAAEAVDPEQEVAASKEASIAQVAVAYLRGAWEEEQAYNAWLRFARFNNYVTNNGYTWENVQAHLFAAGLTQEEWDELKAAYQYLSGGGRPAIMADAKTIQGNWEAR